MAAKAARLFIKKTKYFQKSPPGFNLCLLGLGASSHPVQNWNSDDKEEEEIIFSTGAWGSASLD